MHTVVVNFKQLSYAVIEGANIAIEIELNQPSSKPFQMNISSVDITANGK